MGVVCISHITRVSTNNCTVVACSGSTSESNSTASCRPSTSGTSGADNDTIPTDTMASCTDSETLSLLEKLRVLRASELSLKWKLHENPSSSEGKSCQLPQGLHTDPKSVTPAQRVHEFPTEQLTISAGKLFGIACQEKLQLSADAVESMNTLPFLNDPTIIAGLKTELPLYLAKAADVNLYFDCLEWWERNCSELPNWSSAALKLLLVQPSSAGCGEGLLPELLLNKSKPRSAPLGD